jgi:hypothetical protein
MEFFSPSFKDYYKSSNSEIFSSIFKNGFSTKMKSNVILSKKNKKFDVSDFNDNFITQIKKKRLIKNSNNKLNEIKSFFSGEKNNKHNKNKSNENKKMKINSKLILKISNKTCYHNKKQEKKLIKEEIIINKENEENINNIKTNKNKNNLFCSCCIIF